MKVNFWEKLRNTSPFLIFFPFLIFYVIIVLIFHRTVLIGDEQRYFDFATNLIHGFYSPPPPAVYIPNGPGYPILLIPFAALKLPVVCMALPNAFYYYLSVVFLFKALKQIVSFEVAFGFSLFWACYYNSYQDMVLVVTEPITSLLVSLLIFCLIKLFNSGRGGEKKKYIVLSGITLGYLVLTKIIFGYVLLFVLLASGVLWLINRHSVNYKKNLLFLIIAFATIIPYLFYTYHLTGKLFYFGSSGSDSLYWMSSPYKGEFGDWQTYPEPPPLRADKYRVHDSEDSLAFFHKKDFDEIYKLDGVERDKAFTRVAIKNIRSHPLKFLQNCFSNIGRMLFSYPNSYTLQNNKTLLRLPLNGIIVLLSIFCIFPTLLNWRKLVFSIRVLLFCLLIYLGLSTLVSVQVRMFTVIVPMLLIWIAFILERTVKVRLKFDHQTGHKIG